MSFLDDELLKGTGVALMKVKIKSGCEGVIVRSVVFGISLMAMYMPGTQADQARYKSEIERLDDVRRVVAGESIEDFKSVFSTAIKGPVELCNAMVSDLLNGKKFTAIEPSIIFDQEFPEGAKQGGIYQSQQKMDADKALGKDTSGGIAQCRGADAEGSEDRARVLFSGAGYESGQPPYRIYRLSDKVNPVSTTNIVFWSEFDQHLGRGRDGYLWVDLQKCEYVKGVGVMTSSESLKNDP